MPAWGDTAPANGIQPPTREKAMTARASAARDAFAFSLGGMKSLNSYAFVPAIDDHALNRERHRRRARPPAGRRLVIAIVDAVAGQPVWRLGRHRR